MDTKINHYAAVLFNDEGEKIRGWDYKARQDAEDMRLRLERAGYKAEVWPMNCWGQRLSFPANAA